nr:vascular cell adhesion protein 1-like isoform X1 [Paramormyrops kingsleyae]
MSHVELRISSSAVRCGHWRSPCALHRRLGFTEGYDLPLPRRITRTAPARHQIGSTSNFMRGEIPGRPLHLSTTLRNIIYVMFETIPNWLLLITLIIFLAAADGCLELHPPRVVVRHGDPVSVNCTVSTDHSGMGWAAPVDDVPITPGVQFLTWRVESLTIWDLRPLCFANRLGKAQCMERLSVTVYKPPDSVSVSSVDSADSMVEGSQYQLKCEIQNIAPVQNLTVKWYKGDTLVHEDRDYVIKDKKPVSVASTLLITPSRADDGAEYSCGAELDLGPEGPQPPLAVKSTLLNITVHYPPVIKEGNVSLTVPQGGTVSLSCSAEGKPPPQVQWSYRDAGNVRVTSSGGNSTAVITEASSANEGVYNCTATNWLGSDTATVFVTVTRTSTSPPLDTTTAFVTVTRTSPLPDTTTAFVTVTRTSPLPDTTTAFVTVTSTSPLPDTTTAFVTSATPIPSVLPTQRKKSGKLDIIVQHRVTQWLPWLPLTFGSRTQVSAMVPCVWSLHVFLMLLWGFLQVSSRYSGFPPSAEANWSYQIAHRSVE